MKLFAHQQDGVEFLTKSGGSGALFWEMGVGKTIAAIASYIELRKKTPGLKLLVIAPLSLLHAAWVKDAAAYDPTIRVHNFHEDKAIPKVYDILVINFEGLLGPKNVALLLPEIEKHPFVVVIDESSRMKNPKSKTTKLLLALSKKFRHRIVMSGTPAPNDETEYWAQAEFVKPGIFFGHFFKFRNTYFHLKDKNGRVQQGAMFTREQARAVFSRGFKYALNPRMREAFTAKLATISSRKQKSECLDLPEQIDETREIELTPAQRRIYKEMKTHLITEIKSKTITAPVALTKLMKLREITSGFAIDEDQATAAIPGPNPKLNELMDTIEELGDQQVIIWANFHWEIESIVDKLVALPSEPNVGILYSKTEDRNETIQDFISGKLKYLVAHPRSAAHGLTFVNCSSQIFFSLDYSWETYEQARARTHRAGQKSACTYVHLVARDTIDEDILKVLKRKGDAQELLWNLK